MRKKRLKKKLKRSFLVHWGNTKKQRMNYLYILISLDKPCYKVGITNDLNKRISKITSDFGKINLKNSISYTCDNRQLIGKIEFGIHAYLNNYSYSPLNLGGGSTEWFKIESLEKCKGIIEKFNEELPNFQKISSLLNHLKAPENFDAIFKEIDLSKDFHAKHTKAIEQLDVFISANYKSLSFEKEEGYFVLVSLEKINLGFDYLPKYYWVKIDQNKILFDIKIFNKWKKDRVHNALRDLIKIKFFNEFALTRLEAMFVKTSLKTDT